jgi:hypothetical protein
MRLLGSTRNPVVVFIALIKQRKRTAEGFDHLSGREAKLNHGWHLPNNLDRGITSTTKANAVSVHRDRTWCAPRPMVYRIHRFFLSCKSARRVTTMRAPALRPTALREGVNVVDEEKARATTTFEIRTTVAIRRQAALPASEAGSQADACKRLRPVACRAVRLQQAVDPRLRH